MIANDYIFRIGNMSEKAFTPDTLPMAIRALLELNSFDVTGPLQVHGAEVDLRAESRVDPFAAPIYLEVTVEYVDNTKYAKDLTKFAMLREQEPDCRCIIVSSAGFTDAVRERAEKTRIQTLTYDDLFRKFQRFDRYVDAVLTSGSLAADLSRLESVYEEPHFSDRHGRELATSYLSDWRTSSQSERHWIAIVGDYGTGKTALTRVLQRRWMKAHRTDPNLPLPVRIELRDFTRQFDARTLLHHFKDNNHLSDVPIEFFFHLIRSRRIVLLLDGYDEMAQYMHARERRACLEALAELSSAGARGILTSRPNYFSEAEEFQLFEVLYRTVSREGLTLSADAASVLDRERSLDELLTQQFLNRYERTLQDLDPKQTEALVKRALASDTLGQAAVLSIMSRVFRNQDGSDAISLSGKPVIVTYLLEVVDLLKEDKDGSGDNGSRISEWGIYALIITQLMRRDFRRSPELLPEQRRVFLRGLAMWLSQREHAIIGETELRGLVESSFEAYLQRIPSDRRKEESDRLFTDLRASATLTRKIVGGKDGWLFSHNSLREFLVAEHLIDRLDAGTPEYRDVPISDAMRLFVSSWDDDLLRQRLKKIAQASSEVSNRAAAGRLLTMCWSGGLRLYPATASSSSSVIQDATGGRMSLDGFSLTRITISSESLPQNLQAVNFSGSHLSRVQLSYALLDNVSFSGALLEEVGLSSASLRGANFQSAFLLDVNMTDADVGGADFRGIRPEDISIIIDADDKPGTRLQGFAALGYVAFRGAQTENLPIIHILRHHHQFDIIDKILRKLAEQAGRQHRGLTQRGEARKDPSFARKVVDELVRHGFAESPRGRAELISPTSTGREMLSRYLEQDEVPDALARLLRSP